MANVKFLKMEDKGLTTDFAGSSGRLLQFLLPLEGRPQSRLSARIRHNDTRYRNAAITDVAQEH